ncbi:flagellin N-terminal helical domain-containing protein [Desulforhabdus amnigena]|jgi:flagellin|uniref:Flagellin n=1 Tax=Desulforhabdus amnigena TaxID=40218 RepID=A0A9W6FTK8_9BACT|nr:flagellin [Desulforhabdus amnigena]NLJ27078.1 hypothetical protein [Deltaproteobacteria bacterium]GLI33531.1 hypothetical protein DAMNIGENAA_09640 [Desulforhabdus amnigena]
MALTVNTNVSSLTAQRNVNKTQSALQKSLARLSSGLRINSAKDDAAGLAISNRMNAQVRGLDQAVRNANDGISLAQTAEGALSEVTTNLQRLRELAVQSANASNSADDRAALQDEASQLLDEIERIATQTEFNGTKLLDGSFKAQNFQIGANAGQTLSVTVDSTRTDKLGVSNTAALTARGSSSAISEGDLIINGVTIRSSSAADDTASYPSSSKASSAIAKAAAINASSTQTGVTAKADVNVVEGASMVGAEGKGKITINGVEVNITTTSDTAASRAAVVQAINMVSGQTGVTAADTGQDETGVTLTAADGRNITIKFDQTDGRFDASTTGIRGLTSNERDGADMSGADYSVGDIKGVITVNGVDTAIVTLAQNTDAATSRKSVIEAINAISSQTGVTAVDGGDDSSGVKLVAADGREIRVSLSDIDTDGDAGSIFDEGTTGIDITTGGGKTTVQTDAGTDYGSYTLTSDKEIVITAGAGANANVANAGLVAGTYSSQTAYTSTTSNNGLAMGTGDVKINGVLVGASQASSDTYSRYSSAVSASDASKLSAASAISKAAAINAVSGQTGVTAVTNATSVDGANMTGAAAGTGTITINGVETSNIGVAAVGTDANVAASNRSAVIAAINAISEQTGVTAVDTNSMENGIKLVAADGRNINIQFGNGLNSANTGIKSTASSTAITSTGGAYDAAFDVSINGVNIKSVADPTDIGDVVDIINQYSTQTGVTASDDGNGELKLTASNGSAISVTGADAATLMGTNVSALGSSSTSFGTLTLSSASEFTIEKGTTANLDNTGLAVGTYGSGKTGMALSEVDISTAEGATKAITAIDNALKQVDSNRGKLGAVQNRFEATISNLSNVSENLSAASGRIVDADFAAETASLTKYQILQQAGVAMLAQANQLPQQVLSLLQG